MQSQLRNCVEVATSLGMIPTAIFQAQPDDRSVQNAITWMADEWHFLKLAWSQGDKIQLIAGGANLPQVSD